MMTKSPRAQKISGSARESSFFESLNAGALMIDVPRDDLVLMLEAGYIYLAMGRFREAREIFEGISVLAPKHEVPRVALANVLFAQKKFLNAIRVLKEAIKLNPKSAFAFSHLGEALLFNGKKDEALKALGRAHELEPRGKAAGFARSLSDLVKQGFDPSKFREQAKTTPTPA